MASKAAVLSKPAPSSNLFDGPVTVSIKPKVVVMKRTRETADTLAAKQKDISVSEFFAKNRHLLGFDNPRKALLTSVKEAVDNSLDAAEEGQILPEIWITIEALNTGARPDPPKIASRKSKKEETQPALIEAHTPE